MLSSQQEWILIKPMVTSFKVLFQHYILTYTGENGEHSDNHQSKLHHTLLWNRTYKIVFNLIFFSHIVQQIPS